MGSSNHDLINIIVVGAKVPASVELKAVPADWGPSVSKYRYVYSNDRVMLVDPGTRTVVHEIDGTAELWMMRLLKPRHQGRTRPATGFSAGSTLPALSFTQCERST